MSGFSETDWLTDFTRRVKKLMAEVVTDFGEKIEWEVLPVTATNPHARIVVDVEGEKRQFQIDQEVQALGATDFQIKEELREKLRDTLRA